MLGPIFIAVLATVPLAPFLFLPLVRLLLRVTGATLKSKTAGRRDAVYTQYRRDAKVLEDKNKSEEGWEKIEKNGAGASTPTDDWSGIIGFFHPFCNAGGGGERVLWAAIATTQRRYPKAICAVYTGDHEIERSSMIARVKDRFDITLQTPTLQFVYLSKRHYVLANTWPHFTLLGQSLGSLILAYEAFSLLAPDVFIDTMGYAFAVTFCKLLFPRVPTAAYVHYPTISTDMLSSLDDTTGEKGINSGKGAGLKGQAKKFYWRIFARVYGWVGRQIDVVMCNSTWTSNHITQLWSYNKDKKTPASIVYPPCAVGKFISDVDISANSEQIRTRNNAILYIAQFRPEKNHTMVLRAFAKYYHGAAKSQAKLVLIGSVRVNTPDERHIYSLRLLARELKIEAATKFFPDASFDEMLNEMQRSNIGVNGMYSEHFGIGNVEGIAAGLIPVVHNSGGPKLDIVVPYKGQAIGFHAENADEYAAAFAKVGAMSQSDRLEMRLRGRESSKRFTEEIFDQKWDVNMDVLIKMAKGVGTHESRD